MVCTGSKHLTLYTPNFSVISVKRIFGFGVILKSANDAVSLFIMSVTDLLYVSEKQAAI